MRAALLVLGAAVDRLRLWTPPADLLPGADSHFPPGLSADTLALLQQHGMRDAGTAPPKTMPTLPPLLESDDSPRLLVLVDSSVKYVDSRMPSNLETWIPLLGPKDEVMTLLSDPGMSLAQMPMWDQKFPFNEPKLHAHRFDCPDGHVLGPVCKKAEALRVALPRLAAGEFDYMFVMDDDAYLHAPNLKRKLREGEGGDAFGVWGCGLGDPLHRKGWCGSGGYGLSAAGARKLLETPPRDLTRTDLHESTNSSFVVSRTRESLEKSGVDAYVNDLIDAERKMLAADPGYVEPDDVLIGDSFQRAGLNPHSLGGLYGWNPYTKAALGSGEVTNCETRPVVFHHISAEDKHRVHNEIRDHGCDSPDPRKTRGRAAEREILDPPLPEELADEPSWTNIQFLELGADSETDPVFRRAMAPPESLP